MHPALGAGVATAAAAALAGLAGHQLGSALAARRERPNAPPPHVVTITAREYQFGLPSTVPAGPIAFHLADTGREPHHAAILRLEGGKTAADLAAALKTPGPLPPWARMVGGPNAVDPGGSTNATLVLEPGRYAVICLVTSADGVPHFAKGMIAQFEVTGAKARGALPRADLVLRLTDYAFTPSRPLAAGRQVIRVENAGPQTHEVVLARLEPGQSLDQVIAWEKGGEKGPFPVALAGGIAPMDSGRAAQFETTLKPGRYALICFVPDVADGKAHLMHGMGREIAVK